MDTIPSIIIGCALLAIVYAIYASSRVFAASAGTAQMQEIAKAIQEGAQAYLNRQYTTISIVGGVVAVLYSLCRHDGKMLRYKNAKDDRFYHQSILKS